MHREDSLLYLISPGGGGGGHVNTVVLTIYLVILWGPIFHQQKYHISVSYVNGIYFIAKVKRLK